MDDTVVPDEVGNLSDAQVGVLEEFHRLCHPCAVEVGCETLSAAFLEGPAELIPAHAGYLGELVQRQVFHVVLIDVKPYAVDDELLPRLDTAVASVRTGRPEDF